MLILSRKLDETIVIDGRIIVKIMKVEGETVKLGILAPPDVPVHRQEVFEEIMKNNKAAQASGWQILPKLNRPGKQPKVASTKPAVESGPESSANGTKS
jgi:carbon storage regulator